MDIFQLRVFQRQALDQCRFLVLAAQGVNFGMQQHDTDLIFFNLQNMLNAGANISKIMWGQKGKKAAERQQLRASVNIADNSPLRDVNMRNNFEHMDERIDRWWSDSVWHNHIDKIVGPPNGIAGAEPTDMFRTFDPVTKEVVFWGERFDVQKLVSEVQRIIPLLEAEAAKPHWNEA